MYRKNTAGQFVHFQGVDATTGGIKSGVTWTMRRCLDGTFAAGGGTVTEDGTAGWYKCALAQADTNGNNCAANFTGTGAVPQTVNFLTDGSPPDINVKNLLGTAWLTPGTAGTPDVNVKLWNALTTVALPLVPTVAGRTLNVDASGRGLSDIDTIKTNPVVNGGTITFPTNATLASTTNITAGVITIVTTVTNQLTAAAIATGVWQDATASDFTTANSIGKSLYTSGVVPGGTNGLFIAGTNAATVITTSLTTHFVGTIDTVTTYTGNTVQTGDSYARIGAPVGASISADIAEIEGETDTLLAGVNVTQLNGDATSAANIAKTTRAIARGTASGVPTTTSIPTSAFTPAGAATDQFKGRIVTFDADTTTTALRGQATDITASSNAATPTLTVTALTTAPVSGDTFSVT